LSLCISFLLCCVTSAEGVPPPDFSSNRTFFHFRLPCAKANTPVIPRVVDNSATSHLTASYFRSWSSDSLTAQPPQYQVCTTLSTLSSYLLFHTFPLLSVFISSFNLKTTWDNWQRQGWPRLNNTLRYYVWVRCGYVEKLNMYLALTLVGDFLWGWDLVLTFILTAKIGFVSFWPEFPIAEFTHRLHCSAHKVWHRATSQTSHRHASFSSAAIWPFTHRSSFPLSQIGVIGDLNSSHANALRDGI